MDTNGDGKINSDDRTNIGNGVPDWTFGLNFDAEWKGFDLSVFFQGVSGADVFDATYRQDIASGNYPTWVLQRWTGEGTSNTVPTLGESKNWVMQRHVHSGWQLPASEEHHAGLHPATQHHEQD